MKIHACNAAQLGTESQGRLERTKHSRAAAWGGGGGERGKTSQLVGGERGGEGIEGYTGRGTGEEEEEAVVVVVAVVVEEEGEEEEEEEEAVAVEWCGSEEGWTRSRICKVSG